MTTIKTQTGFSDVRNKIIKNQIGFAYIINVTDLTNKALNTEILVILLDE